MSANAEQPAPFQFWPALAFPGAVQRFSGSAVPRFSGLAVQRLSMFFFFFSPLHTRAARVPGLSVRSGMMVEQEFLLSLRRNTASYLSLSSTPSMWIPAGLLSKKPAKSRSMNRMKKGSDFLKKMYGRDTDTDATRTEVRAVYTAYPPARLVVALLQ